MNSSQSPEERLNRTLYELVGILIELTRMESQHIHFEGLRGVQTVASKRKSIRPTEEDRRCAYAMIQQMGLRRRGDETSDNHG